MKTNIISAVITMLLAVQAFAGDNTQQMKGPDPNFVKRQATISNTSMRELHTGRNKGLAFKRPKIMLTSKPAGKNSKMKPLKCWKKDIRTATAIGNRKGVNAQALPLSIYHLKGAPLSLSHRRGKA